MSPTLSLAQKNYLDEVLGIAGIMRPVASPSTTKTGWKADWKTKGFLAAEVIFVSLARSASESLFEPATMELFIKMLGAMGLRQADVLLAESSDFAEAGADFLPSGRQILVMLDPNEKSGFGAWKESGERRSMTTYHPAYLLKQPEAKRPAWQHLQAVMATLKERKLEKN